jgi:hypothetical protein
MSYWHLGSIFHVSVFRFPVFRIKHPVINSEIPLNPPFSKGDLNIQTLIPLFKEGFFSLSKRDFSPFQ